LRAFWPGHALFAAAASRRHTSAVSTGVWLVVVWLLVVLVLPIVLLAVHLRKGEQIEPTSWGKQFGRHRDSKPD
jgi:hypothetical protein